MKIILSLALVVVFAAISAHPAGREIYPAPARAKTDVAAALKTAAASQKRVLLDFGGNWCPDCRVLDLYFHDARNLPVLQANFVLVHINIGNNDANLDLARRYGVPIEKGVPALAVLAADGRLLYSQKTGQFAPMSRMQSATVTNFLVQWKPAKAGCSVVATNC